MGSAKNRRQIVSEERKRSSRKRKQSARQKESELLPPSRLIEQKRVNILLHVHVRKKWSVNTTIRKKQIPFMHNSLQNLHLHRTSIIEITSKIKDVVNASTSFSSKFEPYTTFDEKNGILGFDGSTVIPIITQNLESDSEDAPATSSTSPQQAWIKRVISFGVYNARKKHTQ